MSLFSGGQLVRLEAGELLMTLNMMRSLLRPCSFDGLSSYARKRSFEQSPSAGAAASRSCRHLADVLVVFLERAKGVERVVVLPEVLSYLRVRAGAPTLAARRAMLGILLKE